MPLNLQPAPPQYDKENEDQTRHALNTEDQTNAKLSTVYSKLLFRDVTTGEVVTVTVDNGVLVVT